MNKEKIKTMNTKIIITILLLAFAQFAFAQKEPIPYEKLEELSKTISDLQIRANGRVLKHNNGDTEELDFKQENFKVWSYNKLVTWTANTKVNNKTDAFLISEDIDFSKAIGIYPTDGEIYVLFPENLNTQVYVSDQNRSINKNPLDIYFKKEDKSKMFSAIYELITLLKIDKGLITKTEVENHLRDYKSLKPYEFYQKYPKSVLAYEGKLLEEDYYRQVRFVNSFANRYNVPELGKIKVNQLISENPEAKEVLKRRRMYYQEAILKSNDLIDKKPVFLSYIHAPNWKPYNSRSIKDDFDIENIVTGVGYTLVITQNKAEALNKYTAIRKELEENLNNNVAEFSYNKEKMNIKLKEVAPYEIISLNVMEHKIKDSQWYEVIVLFNPSSHH